jgi:hypothetical protein
VVIKLLAGAVSAAFLFGGSTAAPRVGGCTVFPADNPWNVRVDSLPVAPNSDAIVATIGTGTGLHPDFGSGNWDGGPIGIPYPRNGQSARRPRRSPASDSCAAFMVAASPGSTRPTRSRAAISRPVLVFVLTGRLRPASRRRAPAAT